MRILERLEDLPAATWNALVRDSAGSLPAFLRHEWLHAMERHGCVGGDSGWIPQHLALFDSDRLVAAAPRYLKLHSWGEYVFDWAWAEAYQRHGLEYYPKLLCAIPFTPVTGPRLLAVDDTARNALVETLMRQARASGLSSLHVLFPPDAEAELLQATGMALRHGVQFHWRNAGYADFEAFLATLAQPKRKKIRAERRKVAESGVQLRRLQGMQIRGEDWDFFSRCYASTYAAHGSTPYLTPGFFHEIGATMPEHLILVLAERGGVPVASSLLVRDEDRVYGRYWGAVEHVPFLHFETAYYQAIEAAIELRLAVVEGGAQGEHKLARGFLAERTTSAHWLAEPAFADAVDRYLNREGQMIDGYLDELAERSPFRPSKP